MNDIWIDLINKAYDESCAVSIGIFTINAEIIYANYGMKMLLGINEGNKNPIDYFVNPRFSDLIAYAESDTHIFEGVFTAGNGLDISKSISAKAYRKKDELCVIGECDALFLENANRQMTSLNQENTNLQRALIKEKKALEITLSELKKTQAMLIHSEKMNALGKLVAGIAHEINNPIGFVISNLHILKNSFNDISLAYSDIEGLIKKNNASICESIRQKYDINFIFEDFDDIFNATLDGVNRVKKIVQNLKSFSRLDEASIKEADIIESIKSIVSIVEPELKKRNIELKLKIDAIPKIMCYSAELNQAFMNIIINSIQAIDNKGVIEISGKEENGQIHLAFSDTGNGISKEVIDKIFDPFFTTKPVGSGTGLGLSIVHSIITEKHKGSIRVESQEGKGTIFHITIPKEL
ncbi:MAG: hypothetical protein HQK76_16740 [Desulfobacterales bacterium]|nr:hypothetical protein [Desulfobacterales bacterium]